MSTRPYRKVFASYSRKDLPIVEEFEHYVAAFGDQYLRDSLTLRTGEVWDERLAEMIQEADIFQLFWSSNSMQSNFVRQEWEHALSLNRKHFVRPVYWEEPLPEDKVHGLPPEALSRLHFQKLMRSSEVERNRAPRDAESKDPKATVLTPAVMIGLGAHSTGATAATASREGADATVTAADGHESARSHLEEAEALGEDPASEGDGPVRQPELEGESDEGPVDGRFNPVGPFIRRIILGHLALGLTAVSFWREWFCRVIGTRTVWPIIDVVLYVSTVLFLSTVVAGLTLGAFVDNQRKRREAWPIAIRRDFRRRILMYAPAVAFLVFLLDFLFHLSFTAFAVLTPFGYWRRPWLFLAISLVAAFGASLLLALTKIPRGPKNR